MALPVFIAAGAKAAGTGAVNPALPAGLAAGDIVILVASTIAGGSISITTNGSITTWTEITSGGIDVTGGEKMYVWWGRYSSGSTAPTVTPGSDHCCAGTIAYSGCVPNGSPIGVSATGSETTSDTSFSFATGLTTGENDCMCLCACSSGQDSNTGQVPVMANASLGSLASRLNYQTNSGGGGGFGISEGTKATAGTMGTFSCTIGTASAKSYVAFSLRPVVAQNVTPSFGEITYTGFAPTVSVGENVNVTPDVGAITYTGFAPTVFASDNKVVTPDVGQIVYEGFAPTIQISIFVSPGVGEILWEGFAPTVTVSDNKNITPDVGQITYEGFAPTVSVSDHKNVTPEPGIITYTGFEPTVSVSDNKNITPDAGQLVWEGFAPTVETTANITAGFGEIVWQGFAPTVSVTQDEESEAASYALPPGNCCDPLIIPFTGVGILNIPYTAAMVERYGNIPLVKVWHKQLSSNELIEPVISIRIDGNPATNINIDNGGSATGYVKIGK